LTLTPRGVVYLKLAKRAEKIEETIKMRQKKPKD